MFAEEDAGGVVLDAFADDDLAANVDKIEDAEDGVAGGGVGFFFFAAAEPGEGIQGGVFGGADEFELDGAFGIAGSQRWHGGGCVEMGEGTQGVGWVMGFDGVVQV